MKQPNMNVNEAANDENTAKKNQKSNENKENDIENEKNRNVNINNNNPFLTDNGK